jgi:flavin-binding protein dodecin
MSSLYELVELSNGEIALKKTDDDVHEPLVTIRFSPESIELLGSSKFNVAKSMIEAAMDAVSDAEDGFDEFDESDVEFDEGHVLH